MSNPSVLKPGEWIDGGTISLRLLTVEDCTPEYVSWLKNIEVNQYLETRWSEQNMQNIRKFVSETAADPNSYLFGIFAGEERKHIGNTKIGPINWRHLFADISYFIGVPCSWGKGFATAAVCTVTHFAFTRLKLHRLDAGTYAVNIVSARVLERAGFRKEGTRRLMARTNQGTWSDVWEYGLLIDDWKAMDGRTQKAK